MRKSYCGWCLPLIIAIANLAIIHPLAAQVTPADAQDILAKYSLSKQGSAWILPAEAEIAKEYANFGALEKKYTEIAKKFNQFVAQSIEARKVFDQALDELKKIEPLLEAPTTPPNQKAQLTAQYNQRVLLIKQAEPLLVILDGQDENPTYKELSTAYCAAKNALTASFAVLKEGLPQLDEKYAELKSNEEVLAALKAAGGKLGPAKSYKLDKRKLALYDTELLGHTHTLLRDRQRVVVMSLVNEKGPLLVHFNPDQEFSLFQQSDLAEAGITPEADAATVTLTAGDKKFECKQIKIPKLRLGKYVWENIEGLAMPAEAKDFGNMLGANAISEYRFDRDVKSYKVTIIKEGDEPPSPMAKGAKKR
ncbi:MAG: hypothetical protein SFX18_17315 [Pirellulales bacterium]|nr:hypothetical protein [Pirellulales bacterium]